MAKQVIDTTTPQPNGKQGEPIRTAFEKTNANFNELYTGLSEAQGGADAALKKAQNLADLADPAQARDNLELGTAAQAGSASEADEGIAARATQDEVNASTAQNETKFVTSKTLWGWVRQATEGLLGMARVATQAQTNSGTDDETFITPKKLRFGVSYLIGVWGYLILPSWLGGFIFQWGSYVNTAGSTFQTFPIPFPTRVYAMTANATNYGSSVNLNAVVISRSSAAFNINTYSGGTTTFVACEVDFFSIGR